MVELLQEFLNRRVSARTIVRSAKLEWLPVFLGEDYRGISLDRVQLYPGVLDVLNELRPRYKSRPSPTRQSAWCLREMRTVGIDGCFDPILVSGDVGYRVLRGSMTQLASSAPEEAAAAEQ